LIGKLGSLEMSKMRREEIEDIAVFCKTTGIELPVTVTRKLQIFWKSGNREVY